MGTMRWLIRQPRKPAMQLFALCLAVVTALASIGVALWTWQAMDSIGDDLRDFVSFEGMHFEDQRSRT